MGCPERISAFFPHASHIFAAPPQDQLFIFYTTHLLGEMKHVPMPLVSTNEIGVSPINRLKDNPIKRVVNCEGLKAL